MANGYLEVTRTYVDNKEYRFYKLLGGNKVDVSIDDIYLANPHLKAIPKQITIGTYKLRVMELDYSQNVAHCVAMKTPLSYVPVILYKAGILIDVIYRKLILTMGIWGLADCYSHTVPSYRDIKLVRKLKEWKDKRGTPRPA